MRLLLFATLAASAYGQMCTNTTYVATGVAQVSYGASTVPSNAYCAPMAFTSNLGWTISTWGWAACPTTFHEDFGEYYWNFSDIFTSDYGAGSNGAGCAYGFGPGFFSGPNTIDCSAGGDAGTVCQRVYLILIGQFAGFGYLPGPTLSYGTTQCSPHRAYRTVTSCSCSTLQGFSCGICGTYDCSGTCVDPCSNLSRPISMKPVP